jgi:LysR family transcriptional regulator, mexEF-oprN operon transcriptional activator
MKPINTIDLRRFDLNLALVFIVIFTERSVTRAGERLFLTQPAISASLARLRAVLNDPLFVSEGRTLRPTPMAETIAPIFQEALEKMRDAFIEREAFTPETSTRIVRLGLLDDLEMGLLRALLARWHVSAPGVKVSVVDTDFRNVAEKLSNDAIDIAVGVFDDAPATLKRKQLVTAGFLGLYDPKQVSLKPNLTLDDFLALRHILVSFSGDFMGLFEASDLGKKAQRNIVASVPRFATIPYLLQEMPAVATLPDYLAIKFAEMFDLAIFELPYAYESYDIEMLWPARLDHDPFHSWARNEVESAFASISLSHE